MSKSDLEASKGRFEAMMDMARVEELSLDSLGMVEESLAASHIQTLCRQVIASQTKEIEVLEHAEAKSG
jgi:hypothetical protein